MYEHNTADVLYTLGFEEKASDSGIIYERGEKSSLFFIFLKIFFNFLDVLKNRNLILVLLKFFISNTYFLTLESI